MLIKYKTIIEKYNLKIENVLHVGAHEAEEYNDYFSNGCKKVVWIEGNPTLAENLKKRLDKEKNIVFNNIVSENDDEEVNFMITNNGQSSSILELGTHKDLYPNIVVVKQQKLKTKKIKTLFTENNLSLSDIDFINLDIQGAELLALKGIGEELHNFKAVYTEVNTSKVYKNCVLLHELDEYLSKYSFKRVETFLDETGNWGDSLYIKKEFGE